MTAHELGRLLLDGPDLMITIRGYEGGVHEVRGVKNPSPLHLNAHTSTYLGSHEYHEGEYCWMSDVKHPAPPTLAIHLHY